MAPQEQLPVELLKFEDPSIELFDKTAETFARIIANCPGRDQNKPTQLRRFYDEICMWEGKLKRDPNKFVEYLPFIRMINAKVAYAQGRKPALVDENFAAMIRTSLKNINSKKSFENFKLFFEAFTGFYKKYYSK